MSSKVKDTDRGWKALMKKAKEDPHVVTVGVQGIKAEEMHKGTTLNNAHLASVHEFGAVIQHPGGTPYIITADGAKFVKLSALPKRKGSIYLTAKHTITIPERSFIRSTIDAHNNYRDVIRKLADALLTGRVKTLPDALKVLGEKVTSDIKRTIEKGIDPANAPSTIAAKGSSKPLIDTGQMKNAITYDVHKDSGAGPESVAGTRK